MHVIWAAGGALAGLVAGNALRGQVFRLSVRSGEPEQSGCPDCAAPLPARPSARCAHCGSWLGAPMAIELLTAAALALLFARFGGQPAAVAFAFLAAIGVALAQIDVAVQRLPDRLTIPAYPAMIVLLCLAAAVDHDAPALLRALLGGLTLLAGYLMLGLFSAGQLGGGDVKLAGLVGIALGWQGWRTLIAGATLGFALAALVGAGLLVARRVSRRSMISFGPYMLGGALIAILALAPGP